MSLRISVTDIDKPISYLIFTNDNLETENNHCGTSLEKRDQATLLEFQNVLVKK